MEVASEISGDPSSNQAAAPHDTANSDFESGSEDQSSSDEEVPKDPQEVLDKAGCLTQLASLKLNDDGSVPLELLQECLQCLLMKKLWPALILCKAISTLDPKDDLAAQLESVIQQKLVMDSSEDSGSESETGSSDNSSCEGDTSSESSGSGSESSGDADDTGDKNVEPSGHSCPACTN